MGYSRSEMLLREVYLFEYIDTIFESAERLNLMKCIVILRPTKENIELLCNELNRPHYKTYHLYFTHRIGPTILKKLAEADETEVVRCVKSLPLDYLSVTPFLFTLKLPLYKIMSTQDYKTTNSIPDCNTWLADGLKRATDGLISAMITLRFNPIIRYQTQSQLCKVLADKVGSSLKQELMINKQWRQSSPFDVNSLLLIVDRRNDLIAPIVNVWSYYSMIHEHFNINSNRINLMDVPNRQPKDPREMLISMENDQFFEENYFKNYGEMGVILKDSVTNLKLQSKSQHKVETMEDMKRFIDEYPETRKYASNLHNHVFLMSELSRIVTEYDLIRVSECEQELACNLASRADVVKKLKLLVSSSKIRALDAIRLVSLYTVCKPDKSTLNNLIELLKTRRDISKEDVDFIRQLNLFSSSKPLNPLDVTVQQVTRMIVQGVKGVENVLTEFRPKLYRVLDDLRRGNKLKEMDFAFYGERFQEEPPKKVILFSIGGVTYEEALIVDQLNRSSTSGIKIVIGGTSIHNFNTFKQEVRLASVSNDK